MSVVELRLIVTSDSASSVKVWNRAYLSPLPLGAAVSDVQPVFQVSSAVVVVRDCTQSVCAAAVGEIFSYAMTVSVTARINVVARMAIICVSHSVSECLVMSCHGRKFIHRAMYCVKQK